MPACHSKKMSEKANEKSDLRSAWSNAAVDIDNAKAILDLVWNSMSDNDWREHLPEGMQLIAGFADTHRFALDASISILGRVSAFFDENECQALLSVKPDHAAIVSGKISDEFMTVLDEYKWAFDAYDELCPTQDEQDARFNPSKTGKRLFKAAEDRHMLMQNALSTYKPVNLAELRLKAKTIADLRSRSLFPQEELDGVVRSFTDFGLSMRE